jgi:hypothetical protein
MCSEIAESAHPVQMGACSPCAPESKTSLTELQSLGDCWAWTSPAHPSPGPRVQRSTDNQELLSAYGTWHSRASAMHWRTAQVEAAMPARAHVGNEVQRAFDGCAHTGPRGRPRLSRFAGAVRYLSTRLYTSVRGDQPVTDQGDRSDGVNKRKRSPRNENRPGTRGSVSSKTRSAWVGGIPFPATIVRSAAAASSLSASLRPLGGALRKRAGLTRLPLPSCLASARKKWEEMDLSSGDFEVVPSFSSGTFEQAGKSSVIGRARRAEGKP